MKKIISAITTLIVIVACLCALVACDGGLQLYIPDGVEVLSVANIINDGRIGGAKRVSTHITEKDDDAIAKCNSGEADLAILPTNAAVKICSTSGRYVMFSVNVYGSLYIVGTRQIESLKDLQGERLFSIGKGDFPETVLKKICSAQNVGYREYDGDDTLFGYIMVKYFDKASTVIERVLQGEADFALLEEPYASRLVGGLLESGKTAYNLFDMQTLWQASFESEQSGYPQASLVVKKDLLTGDFGKRLENALAGNAEFLKQNVDKLGDILQKAGSALTVKFTQEFVDRCNTRFIPAADARADLEKYIEALGGMDGLLPLKEEIFYGGTTPAE